MRLSKLFTLLFFTSHIIMAQTQIENGGFEVWENDGTSEEEPSQWSSLKTSDDASWINLANQAPQVLWKETNNPHSGNSCLKLKVAPYNALVGLSPNAIVTNGRVFASTTPSDGYVFTDESNSIWNTSCTDRPDSLIGWYKYLPQSNDQGSVEVLFHNTTNQGKLPESGSDSHWVGNGDFQFSTVKTVWTRFSFPINYLNSQTANHFLIISSAGNGLNAQENSELFLDDMSFVYNPPLKISESDGLNNEITAFDSEVSYKLATSFIQASMILYSLDGKVILKKQLDSHEGKIQTDLSSGIYLFQLIIDDTVTTGKIAW